MRTSLPCTQLLPYISCRRRTPTPRCGAADVFPFEQYTVIFKNWRALLEMSNSVEDQTIQMVAPASETDEAIPPTKVLPGRTSGVRRSYRRLLSSFLRMSIRTDDMAGNTFVLSGHVLN